MKTKMKTKTKTTTTHQHNRLIDLRKIGGLDLSANANELLAEGVLGGSDKHLALQLGRVRSPLR